MRPRPSLMLTLSAAIILAAGGGRAQQPNQTAEAKKPAPQQAAEPAPPRRATVTRSPLGILVITGASSAPAPAKAGKGPATGEGKEAAQSGREAETPAPAAAPAVPSSTRSTSAGYGLSGQRTSGGISISGTSAGGSSQTTHTLANINGSHVPYLTESQEVLSQTETESIIERRTHRYDTAGRAVSQQLVREEKRTLADGSLETIVTVYESDPSGRMHPAGRTVSVEKKGWEHDPDDSYFRAARCQWAAKGLSERGVGAYPRGRKRGPHRNRSQRRQWHGPLYRVRA